MREAVKTAWLGVACWVVSTWPLVLAPSEVLAHPAGEADNHLWMHWQALHPGQIWANYPVGTGIPLMDPVNLPWFALGMTIHPAMAWSVAWGATVALALLGGAVLGQVVRGPTGARMAMVVLGTAPFLHGVGAFGVTEAWPLGWLALALAALWSWSRRGGWLRAAAVSVCMAAFALGGWYDVVFAGLGLPIALGWTGAHRWARRHWLALAVMVGVAVVPLLPRWWAFEAAQSVWEGRWQSVGEAPVFHAGWRAGALTGGTDVFNLVLPSLGDVGASRAVYLGWVPLAFGALALRRRAPGAGWLAAGVLLFAGLALGRWVTVAGHAVVPGPAGWLTMLLPPLEGLTHWYRAVGPAMVLLAALAALGAPRGWGWAALVVVESVWLSQNPWPREHYDPRPPEALAALPGSGPVVLLPFDNGRTEFGTDVPRSYDRWGPWLERPLSENYEGPDALLANRLLAAADEACGLERGAGAPRARREDPSQWDAAVRRGAMAGLERSGVQWVVLLEERAPAAAACAEVLNNQLGSASYQQGGVIGWKVGAR